MNYTVIIPARYASTRLPGKPLQEIAGKPLLEHVYMSALQSTASEVIIATDDARIQSTAAAFGAQVCMTGAQHNSGTERLAEVARLKDYGNDHIIVNLQGDEYGMPAVLLDQVAELLLNDTNAMMATVCEPIHSVEDFQNPNIVKVVRNANEQALYFSRAPIAWRDSSPNDGIYGYRHIGLYAYRAGFLNHYVTLPPCSAEQSERLEQLRALHHGAVIAVAEAVAAPGLGIDTAADLERARELAGAD